MEHIHEIQQMADMFAETLPVALPAPAINLPLASLVDHTLLKADASAAQIEKLCQEAQQYHFASVCVNPTWVPLAVKVLGGTQVKVCTVVGFPLGATLASIKILETVAVVTAGAQEVDMVLNVGEIKSGLPEQALHDIQGVVGAAHERQALVKVILETSALTREQKILACLLCQEAGADYVKTSTGFGSGGATVEDVDLMHRVVGKKLKVKASGGIRTLADAQAMVAAGASRLGTSAGIQIVQQALDKGIDHE